MSRLLEWMLHLHSATESHKFEAATRDPSAAQQKSLRALVTMNARTAFGRGHGFAQISNSNDYAHAVPIADYESFRPYVNRIAAGEKNVLTGDDPEMFTSTSGTTA
jgi:GH3 auxin-responsive promoter